MTRKINNNDNNKKPFPTINVLKFAFIEGAEEILVTF